MVPPNYRKMRGRGQHELAEGVLMCNLQNERGGENDRGKLGKGIVRVNRTKKGTVVGQLEQKVRKNEGRLIRRVDKADEWLHKTSRTSPNGVILGS